MQIANLEGYHISFLLLVTTNRKPSLTKSNYRDTNPGQRQPTDDTIRAYTPAKILLLDVVLLTATYYHTFSSNLLLVYRQPQTLQQSFALCRLHSKELHKTGFMSAVPSWGLSHVGHTGSTRGYSPQATTTEQSFTPMGKLHSRGEHKQHSPSWNTRLDGTPTQNLCKVHYEGSGAPQPGVK